MISRRVSSTMAGVLLLAGIFLSSSSSAQQVQGKVDFGALQQRYPWLPQLPTNDDPLAANILKGYFAQQQDHRQELISILTEMEPTPPPAEPAVDPMDRYKYEVGRTGVGNAILNMPIGVHRKSERQVNAAYFAAASGCDATIPGVLSFKDPEGDFPLCVKGTGDCRQAASSYDAKCLLKPEQTSLDAAIAGRIEKLTVSLYYHRGITEDGKWDSSAHGPFCSGVLVASDMLITARHCVIDFTGPKPKMIENWHFSARTTMAPDEDVFFIGYYINLQKGMDAEAARAGVDEDWILVKLSRPVGDVETIPLEKPVLDEDLVVSGFSLMAMYATAPQGVEATTFSATHDWTDFVRMDDTAACRVLSAPEGGDCIVHGCQTEHGGSGSPLFAFSQSAGLRLVGIQSRFDDGTQHNGGKCSEDATAIKASPNIAVGVSDDMLEKVKRARGS